MRLRSRKRVIRVAPLLAALAIQGGAGSRCPGQPQSANAAGTSLGRALQKTAETGMPTLAVISSRTNPGSQEALLALVRSPEALALVKSMQFSEMPAEVYPNQVKTLGVRSFPTYVAFRRGKDGIEVAGAKAEMTSPREVFDW